MYSIIPCNTLCNLCDNVIATCNDRSKLFFDVEVTDQINYLLSTQRFYNTLRKIIGFKPVEYNFSETKRFAIQAITSSFYDPCSSIRLSASHYREVCNICMKDVVISTSEYHKFLSYVDENVVNSNNITQQFAGNSI
jgi:hypothetical protein